MDTPDHPKQTITLEWRSWRLLEEGVSGWLKAGLVLALAGLIWLVLATSLPTLVAGILSLAFLVALFPFFLPVTYQVDDTDIQIQHSWGGRHVYEWQTFGYYVIEPKGYWLIATRTRLFLPLPSEVAAQTILLSIITQHLERQEKISNFN